MWWIILIIIILDPLFLWLVVHNVSHNVDEETQKSLDEEQTRAVDEYMNKDKAGEQSKSTSGTNFPEKK